MSADASLASAVGDALSVASPFNRHLTPTWLATTCLLNGQRPPDLTLPFRFVHLGCGTGVTAAVVAAVHPAAEVWAWDAHASNIEATRRLRDAAGLANLTVHERPGLPADLGGPMADIVVVQDVMIGASDELRAQIVDAIGANLRPGGLACVTYKTTVGWIEIAPVITLMRYVAMRTTGAPDGVVDHVIDLLATLRAGGAKHLTERPAVAAWLDEIAVTDDATIVDEYLRDPFRPMSHAQVSAALSTAGCEFIGSARLTDELGDDVPSALVEVVQNAPTRTLQEAYRDLAVRRTERLDVFRLGLAPLTMAERATMLSELALVGLEPGEDIPAEAVNTEGDPAVWRRLFETCRAHPRASRGPSNSAVLATTSLNSALAEQTARNGGYVCAVPFIGTAVDSRRPGVDALIRLGSL